MDAAVCSSDAACCSVRDDRSVLPAAIWPEAEAMLSTPARIRATVAARLPFIVCKARISWPISSRERTAMLLVRSLAATVRATASASDSGCVMLRVSRTASSRPLSKPMAPITIIHRLALAYSPWISWARASISARCTLDSFEIRSMNCRVAGRNSWANTRSAVATSPSFLALKMVSRVLR